MAGCIEKQREVIGYFMEKDVLLSSELINFLSNEEMLNIVSSMIKEGKTLDQILSLMKNSSFEEKKPENSEISKQQIKKEEIKSEQGDSFKIVRDYELLSHKREVDHFVTYFNARYKQLEAILKNRKELSSILSIARLKAKKDRENVSILGLVQKKETTKNENIMLTVEDPTGEIKVLINKSNKELYALAKDLVEDEVIGVLGMNGDNILFANSVVQPDVPLDKEFKKHDQDVNVVFLSDTHFGSKYFLQKEFEKFLSWLRQETGSEKQREIASKVKFLFIAGDLVDGVGIYPNQELELSILDIYKQYESAAEYLSKIPEHIKVIISPGNHDAVRLSEPQPRLSKDYAKAVYGLKNVSLVSNPAYINICADGKFSGFDVLLYHGYSFDHYFANVDSIRLEGGYDRADLIMKFLLKRRHLAPSYASTLVIPDLKSDNLVIDKIPDFFITGHIHKTAVSSYRNITLICGSCWQSITSFQKKVGHHPEPARVPVVNLKTRKVTILNFESAQNGNSIT
jgi:DNA polymerase II small subunit